MSDAVHHRAPGTGRISTKNGWYYVYAPGTINAKGERIGDRFGSRYQAERALAAWLKEHGAKGGE